VSAEQAGSPARHRRDALLASRARTDLLGLTDPAEPVVPVDLDAAPDTDGEQ